jgi:hypothetical protein
MILLVTSLACTANQPPAAPPPPVPAVRNPEFKNVQVLPHTMSRDELIRTMQRFTQALGVRCDHCHVAIATTPKPEFDFPSDEKEAKRVARVMIRMVHDINGEWLERVEEAENPHESGAEVEEAPSDVPRVNCWTCHRGHKEPEMPPALPPRS